MKKLFYLFTLIILASCNKGDNAPSHGYNGFRAPDCGNTAGEGIWEHYNDAESTKILHGYINDETEDTSYIKDLSIDSHNMTTGKLHYYQKKPVSLGMFVQYSDSWSVSSGTLDTGKAEQAREVSLSDAGPLMSGYSGCFRLYYVFSCLVRVNGIYMPKIVTKGHFDVNL